MTLLRICGRGVVDHSYLLALHQDKQHPHVHVVVNNVGYDLKPLGRDRDDLMRWRETFARELRAGGIEAEATPRKTRGVIQKPYNRKVRLAAQTSKEKHGDFRDARVYQSKVRDAANAMRGIGRDQTHVAEVRARENRELAERIMKDAIEKLGQQGEGGRGDRRTIPCDYATACNRDQVFQREISRETALAEVRDALESQRAGAARRTIGHRTPPTAAPPSRPKRHREFQSTLRRLTSSLVQR